MFDWLRRKQLPPPLSRDNPGKGAEVKVAYANGERSWGEHFNLLDGLEEVFAARSIVAKRGAHWLTLDSGIVVQPQFVEVQPLDDGNVRTITTIDVSHPVLAVEGLFEYQHSQAESALAATKAGMQGWADLDLPVFMDALRDKPERCMVLKLDPKAESSEFPVGRRVILGPTTHVASVPATEPAGAEHEFCPCCMFTKNHAAFWPLLDGDSTRGIRFFAIRDAEGMAAADCRVNGQDWAPGIKALTDYVATWPARGLEFRKQFGLIHSLPV